ncbi:MAG: rhombosortase [Nibricoccus sp.]
MPNASPASTLCVSWSEGGPTFVTGSQAPNLSWLADGDGTNMVKVRSMLEKIKDILDPKRLPWYYLAIVVVAAVAVAVPSIRPALVYNRAAISQGELWRIWTGHLVHFGWPHGLADGSLFVLIGWVLERSQKRFSHLALLIQPVVVSAALYWFDPMMNIYGGLSGLNVGLLVFLACRGWHRDRLDWFWPAILLIHVAEIFLEIRNQGTGGGAIRFDDSSIRVATVAHIGGVVFGVASWAILAYGRKKAKEPAAPQEKL